MTKPPIPRNTSEVTPQWMQQALTAGGATGLPPIKRVVLEEIGGAGIGLMGAILRCRLSYHAQSPAAPESVILKLPGANARNLRISKRLQLYKREYDYYTLAAPRSPLRSPALLYGDFEAGANRFVLLLEDLRDMQMVSQLEGASAEQAKQAVRALARLHGTFWNRSDQPPLDRIYDALAAQRRAPLQLAYAVNLVPALARFDSFFSDGMRGLAEAYVPCIAEHIARVAAGPVTLIHGDCRLDNIFFAAGSEEDIAVIDWQVSARGTPLYDAAYFLGSSVTTAVRRQIERDALQEYTGILCEMGVQGFTFEECWRLYRDCMLGRLLSLVLVCGGMEFAEQETRRLAEVGLRRTLAAIEDLDAGACLPARPRWWSGAGLLGAVSRGVYGVRGNFK